MTQPTTDVLRGWAAMMRLQTQQIVGLQLVDAESDCNGEISPENRVIGCQVIKKI